MELVNFRRIFVFLGPVGVGKSTQVKLLTENLRNRGLKVSSTQLKSFHILSNMFVFFLIQFLRERSDKNRFQTLLHKRSQIATKLFTVITLLDIPSFMLRYLITILLPLRLGYIVLVEEYIPATIADYIFWLKKMNSKNRLTSGFIALAQKLILKNQGITMTVYMNASPSALNTRIKVRNTHGERIEYVEMQQSMLLSIAKELTGCGDFHYIETTDMDAVKVKHNLLSIIVNSLGI